MPKFEVEGFGRDTGRKRRRTYEAGDAEGAIEMASADGTIVDPSTLRRVYPIHHFFSKVAGVTHANRDGTDRQSIVLACRRHDVLSLRREPRNRYSAHAVAVLRAGGEQVGYVPDETAEGVAAQMDGGCLVFCYAMDQTGGQPFDGKPTVGLNLLLLVAVDADTPATALQAYMDAHAADFNR